jgi:hypothetical protein
MTTLIAEGIGFAAGFVATVLVLFAPSLRRWIRQVRCDHDWERTSQRFLAPVAITSARNIVDLELLIHGRTVKTWRCSKCHKTKHTSQYGDTIS